MRNWPTPATTPNVVGELYCIHVLYMYKNISIRTKQKRVDETFKIFNQELENKKRAKQGKIYALESLSSCKHLNIY